MSDDLSSGSSIAEAWYDAENGESRISETKIPDVDSIRGIAYQTRAASHVSSSTREEKEVGGFDDPFTSQNPLLDPISSKFDAIYYAKNMMSLFHSDPERYPESRLGVGFRNLAAYGYNQDVNYQLTVGNLPLWLVQQAKALLSSREGPQTYILKPMDGYIDPGELCMVLGRPGAGCSSFLRTIATQTYGFKVDKSSEISYMGLTPEEINKTYRGEVTYCGETEMHFPTLTVGETLQFAARMRTPKNRPPGVGREQYAKFARDVVMATYGLTHTVDTKVGNEVVRGVSGGERKRVSIAELALTSSSLQCWDNSTRGLDAATALEFVRTLRLQSRIFRTSAFIAIYQASEDIYSLFDKVLVLYDGYQIYFGPISLARQFFFEMGWEPKPRQSTPDFLTSLSQPSERKVRNGFHGSVPKTASEFNKVWRESGLCKQVLKETETFMSRRHRGSQMTQNFVSAFNKSQSKYMPPKEPYIVSFKEQIFALCIRGWQRMAGAPEIPLTYVLGQVVLAFVVGSLFYNMPNSSGSLFHREAMIFFSLLINAFFAQMEIFSVFEARPVVQKHQMYAFYHPTVDALGSIITDLPVKFTGCFLFNTILYFLSNLRREAGNYFFFLLVMILTVLLMSHLFRTIAACTRTLPESMVPAMLFLIAMVLFTGFAIPIPHMLGWCRWINYLDPLAYSYEALITNEFHNRSFECSDFIPYSPSQGATDEEYVCSVVGSQPGKNFILGDNHIGVQYDYYFAHQWRNIGIIIGFMFFFLATYLALIYLNPGERTRGEVLIYPRTVLRKILQRQGKQSAKKINDGQNNVDYERNNNDDGQKKAKNLLDASDDIFYWKDVCYDIKIKGKPRRLLNYIDGWVRPGTITALMGATGAGKTTLLDTLASRVTTGIVQGQMFVNGKPRDAGFQRSTGYVMQQDLHLSTSTVREALIFSAVLRQPTSVGYSEKVKYVDNVLKILEMEDYADAVVGVPGGGLNVEQRKRLTIGVELAAKPKLLLFLDEPTSGLDSQTAWSVSQLLKKLSGAGQAILCTIHQPSALLLEQFDRLLFLASGGRTIYFGDIGPGCSSLISYFESKGSQPCPPESNPAEWILEVVGAAPGTSTTIDWPVIWLESDERHGIRGELDRMMSMYGASSEIISNDPEDKKEFAASFWRQYLVVLHRVLQQYWRTPSYIWAKLLLNIFNAIFNGFGFFKSRTTIQGMQNIMFSIFCFTIALPSVIQQYLPVFVASRDLYEARERPAKIFSWESFILAILTAELPWQLFIGTLSFLCWYYPAGLYQLADSSGKITECGGLTYFYVLLFYTYAVTFGQLCIAPMREAHSATTLATILYALSLMFAGVLITMDEMPHFWTFMYRASPMTYWIGGMLMLGISDSRVKCSETEFSIVYPPQGQRCDQWFSDYFENGGVGYLTDDASYGPCHFCSLAHTNTYLASLKLFYSERWRNFGIFWAYIGFNVFGCILLYWVARVPKSKSKIRQVSSTRGDPALEAAQAVKSQT